MVKWKYYMYKEVALHCKPDDLWVTLFGKVLNLTPLIQEHKDDPLRDLILMFGGKDISHLFDKNTKELRIHVDPNTNKVDAFVPFGRFMDVPSQEEIEKEHLANKERDLIKAEAIFQKFIEQTKSQLQSKYKPEITKPMAKTNQECMKVPWWKDEKYVIGVQSHHSRLIRMMNMLTKKEITLEVPCEEHLNAILERYKVHNAHATSYTWKFLGSNLDMQDTLDNNGILDLTDKFERLRLNERDFIPVIHLHYDDDLTDL